MALSEIKPTSERIKITQIKKSPSTQLLKPDFPGYLLWIHGPFSIHSSSLSSFSWDKLPMEAQHQLSKEAGYHLFYSSTIYMKLPFLKIKTNLLRSQLKLMETNYFKVNWRSGKTGDWPEDTACPYTLCLQFNLCSHIRTLQLSQ